MQNSSSIAIVGIGGVFPGAKNLHEFWQNIVHARDCSLEVDADRWRLNQEQLYAPELMPDKVNSRRACLLENFEFNADDLAVDAALIGCLDPLYQILLHAGREAWNDANVDQIDKQHVGVIIGNIVLPTEFSSRFSDEIFKALFEQQLNISNSATNKIEALNCYVAGSPAGLLSQSLGLGAGTYTLDAACASSLYALKYATDELLSGRTDTMLVGGISRPDCLYTQMGFSQLNAISKSGRCSPFDQKADGLVVGEGAGVFILKRLQDAIAHGDHIYATIEGVGLSNDVGGNIMSPDTEGQLRAMQAAYTKAGWLPNQVQHIECHGTGTPVGDVVEFNSLTQLWQSYNVQGDCVIGSVKSNVGHLLTAAGAAALMKTLLAMKYQQLPPTANFNNASDKIDLENSPFEILQQARDWQSDDYTPRRAAISGFGFGGINAHVLLQEYKSENHTNVSATAFTKRQEDIAIIGMDARLGCWNNLAEFEQASLLQQHHAAKVPEHWWGKDAKTHQTYSIEELSIPLGRYRIPPAELKEMLPQQLLMLELAANAMADAGLSELKQQEQLRTAVFIGIALDMNTTNFHFRWMQENYARQWLQYLGIEADEFAIQEWIQQLREASWPALNANRTMGALGGVVASRIAKNFRVGGPAFTVAAEEISGLRALELGIRSLQQHELDQVIVGAVDLASDLRASLAYTYINAKNIIADGATALVLKRLDHAIADNNKIYATIKGFGVASSSDDARVNSIINACVDAECQLADIDVIALPVDDELPHNMPLLKDKIITRFPFAHVGAANGLMAIAQAVSSLHKRVLSTENQQPMHWLKDKQQGPRCCLVSSNSVDGNSASVILQQADSAAGVQFIQTKLFTLAAENKLAMLAQLRQLSFSTPLPKQQGAFRVALLAKNENELQIAIKEVAQAIENNKSIDNQHCCYLTDSLYEQGKLAFVYPGSGNHFYGMGQDLGVAFPNVLEKLQAENDRLATQFAHGRFWQIDSGEELSHEEVIFAQVWLGTFVSDVVGSFAIKPDAIIGYSLGETVGLFSTRTWKDRDEMLDRIHNSSLFTEDLAGPCRSVQQAWATDQPVNWILGVINASADVVNEVIHKKEKVYLLIVNTANECVIGGDSKAVEETVQALHASFLPLSGVTTVHCKVAKPVAKAYRDLHIFNTTPPEDIRFYSGASGGAYKVTSNSAADAILQQAIAPFDYTKVINSAYKDGVRLFIEVGPGASCSRMINKILAGKPHYTKAVCVKGQNSTTNLLQLLARLYVEGVPIDVRSLESHKKDLQYKDFISLRTGGEAFKVPSPPTTKEKPLAAKEFVAKMAADRKDFFISAAANSDLNPFIQQMQLTEQARTETQQTFLRLHEGITTTITNAINMQMQSLKIFNKQSFTDNSLYDDTISATRKQVVRLTRAQCMEFAIGSIAKVLGEEFSLIDDHQTRVRLPDEPLMLVDRVLIIEGEQNSMSHGRVVTEHDVLPNAWYLDFNRIPTCIAVEAGQADLFLAAYLGIDNQTKGNAVYRLLDASITFHGPLPKAGETIRYDISIEKFFRQNNTWLFRFNFEGTVNNKTLLSMTHGCAGFFTQAELDAGQGIVLTGIEKQSQHGSYNNYQPLVTMAVEKYSDEQLHALRKGDLAACFGEQFAQIGLQKAVGLPSGRMNLVQRILHIDPTAGCYGIGQITGEADIHADDWFLVCHFVDDRVMPGTLMYECCLHTLRVYLLRIGWVAEVDEFVCEPIIGELSQLKCRGQVTENTKSVQYEISLKEIGYQEDGTPYALADALMYADHKAIVQMKNMSVQLSGLHKNKLEALWKNKSPLKQKKVLFNNDAIMAFATGNPSAAFGDRYKVFDSERKIARLPRPPYKFLDRIVAIENCEQWVLKAGAVIEAEYDVPKDAWYFIKDNQPYMPFAVLLEVALQPCGWLAAYLGSALTSEHDLSFRNLGGEAKQYSLVTPDTGMLTTKVIMTNVSQSAGMLIQHYDYEVSASKILIYKGNTYFGFFTKQVLAEQVGIREAKLYQPTNEALMRATHFTYPSIAPMQVGMMRMLDRISVYDADGGPEQIGYIEGKVKVNEEAWFFKAHFYEDPVWPGSLGLESFMQLLKVFAWQRWGGKYEPQNCFFESMALDHQHSWVYRGQILPVDDEVTVQAVITKLDDNAKTVFADGFLLVDGRVIYQINNFALRIVAI